MPSQSLPLSSALRESVESHVSQIMRSGQRYRHEYAEKVRRAPLLFLFCAAATGYFLNCLPLATLMRTALRILLATLRPTLLLLGIMRFMEEWKHQCGKLETEVPQAAGDSGVQEVDMPLEQEFAETLELDKEGAGQ